MTVTIELSPSGITFPAEKGETILDAAHRAQVLLPYGCRNGACGSCRGRILAGEIGYEGNAGPRGLSERERAKGWALLCLAHAHTDARILAQPFDDSQSLKVRTLPGRVAQKVLLAHDVMGLELVLPPTERLQYLAGQYIDILLPDGRRRAFSLANPPHDDRALELHIRRVPGGLFSERVFDDLPIRSLLRLQGPLGSFYLRAQSGRPRILVAGGTGFAPIKAMIENALHEGIEAPIHLYRGVRAERDLYLDELPRRWAVECAQLTYTPVLSEPEPGGDWRGKTGFVHAAVLEDFPDLRATEAYASGPPAMVDAIRDAFPDHGLELEHLFSDTFEYAYETGHDA